MTTPPEPSTARAVIVGAGPAGISAALWLRRLQVPFRLLDRGPAVGGELLRVNLPIEDYPGRRAADGRALARHFARHLRAAAVEVDLGVEVQGIDLPGRRIETSAGALPFAALVLAIGLVRRRLGVPGEAEYPGRGVSYSATTDLAVIAGQDVIVVGGGDGAFENATILAGVCPHVTLVVRGPAPRARPALRDRCLQAPNVTLLTGCRALAVEGDGRGVTGLRVAGPAGERSLAAAWVVVKVGFAPQTGFLQGQLDLTPEGHIRVDRALRSSVPGVFAAGDIANPYAPSVAAAVGDGAVAARGVLQHLLGAAPMGARSEG
jgi:thioredoxin reductase (NADPH)